MLTTHPRSPRARILRKPSSSNVRSSSLLQGAIEDLPLHFREVLLLCEVEEMSYQEIGEALAIPIGTVMSRLSRARKALRENLRQKLQGG